MHNHREDPTSEGGSGGRYCAVHPERDLEANWEVDLSKKLEEYLLKICSGEITDSEEEEDSQLSVNFAEAALLLQGSVQVYSRKVEYVYSLVLHALEFISQNGHQDQSESTPVHPQKGSHAVPDEELDLFWGLDDVPVEERNCLDSTISKDALLNHFVKPPANLLVLEGDCLDTAGDGGELESYLLATNDLYQDFILLDPCDAAAVHDFLGANKGQNDAYKGNSTRKSYLSPTIRSGGSARKSTLRKSRGVHLNKSPLVNQSFEVNDGEMESDHPACANFDNKGFDIDDGCSEPVDLDDSDEDDDPWKPLNPHEPGNLRVKPFRKVNACRRHWANSTKRVSLSTLFPLAKMEGTISPELTELWERQRHAYEKQRESQSPPPYEKLRQSLINGGHEAFDASCDAKDDDEDNGYDDNGIPNFGQPDVDMSESMHMDEDVNPLHEKHNDGPAPCDDEVFGCEEPNSHASLEDLCRSHMDALLASIAKTEKQTELAARVSTWKQKIEQNLEEQDSRPPFDIHEYGERILDKLTLNKDNENVMSFADVVMGQEKHDVARTFSALLQLNFSITQRSIAGKVIPKVNNGDVDLDKGGGDSESVCYTAVNPFHVRLLSHDKRQKERRPRSSKKRVQSPTTKECNKGGRLKVKRKKSLALDSFSS